MTKIEALEKLIHLEPELPYGSKVLIAKRLGVKSRHTVQAAFRGMAGKDLTFFVYKEAKKILNGAKRHKKMSAAHLVIRKKQPK